MPVTELPPEAATAERVKKKVSSKRTTDKSLVKFDPLQRYLSEVSRYRLLTRDEERELAIKVREYGDRDAAYQALLAHPLGPKGDQVQAVLDDLLETHRPYLPAFWQ